MACKEQNRRVEENLFSLNSSSAKLSTKSPHVNRATGSQIQSLEFVESKAASTPVVADNYVLESKPDVDTKSEEVEPVFEETKPESTEPHVIPDSMDFKVNLTN